MQARHVHTADVHTQANLKITPNRYDGELPNPLLFWPILLPVERGK
jgi:hypothetical protein